MNEAGQIIGILGGICGLVVLAAAIAVVAKGSFSKASLAALREDNKDLRDRVSDLEHKEEMQAKDITRLMNENILLKGMVTSKAKVEELREIALEQHEQNLKALHDMTRELISVSAALGKLQR